jgi:hypothetical protein
LVPEVGLQEVILIHPTNRPELQFSRIMGMQSEPAMPAAPEAV